MQRVVDGAQRQGIYADVHGHRDRTNGQSVMLRPGMIGIEGDATMDRDSRRKDSLKGHGMGVTLIAPTGV